MTPPKGQGYVQVALDADAMTKVKRSFHGLLLSELEKWSLIWCPQGGKLLKFGNPPQPGTTTPWVGQDHVCLIRLTFNAEGIIQLPLIMNSCQLPGQLSRAVTSTKISPTCRYALVGYGVRTNDRATDHPINT